ncbi:hypothetical protein DRP07_05060 [Archaeoglobales archaeon]|nr:MAG: hypothetical protein DRP07_05060 [Archaeoglobales archaeon]
MKKEIEIYDKGLEEYPKSNVVISNFLMILWIALGNYYDKWCNTGLGKLCALLFKRGDIEKFGISSFKVSPLHLWIADPNPPYLSSSLYYPTIYDIQNSSTDTTPNFLLQWSNR